MARSTRVIATASFGGRPVERGQDHDHSSLDEAQPRRRERDCRQQRCDEGDKEGATDAQMDVEAERQHDQVQAQRLGAPR